MKTLTHKERSNKSYTAYTKTQTSLDTQQRRFYKTTAPLVPQQNVEQNCFKTESFFLQKKKYGQSTMNSCLFTQPCDSYLPYRSKTELTRPSFNNRLMVMVDKSKKKVKRRRSYQKRRQYSKISHQKSKQQKNIQKALFKIEQEKKYHKRFMEMINRKVKNNKEKENPRLRQPYKVQKMYTESTYSPLNEQCIPDYLDYASSFYSRSRHKCFKQVFDPLHPVTSKNTEQPDKSNFSYLEFIADVQAKKKFKNKVKLRNDFNGVQIMKSKEKILNLYRKGSKSRQFTNVLIDDILRQKKQA